MAEHREEKEVPKSSVLNVPPLIEILKLRKKTIGFP
jgi:hypothetical protein